jgi:membrane fusion protein (multidrug efflux system)
MTLFFACLYPNYRLITKLIALRQFIFLASVLLLLISCKEEKPAEAAGKRKEGTPAVFEAVVANAYPLSRTIEAPGTIMPNENTEIHPEVSGRVVAINFKEGTVVSKGALLVKLFDDDLQAQLKKLQVQLEIANATTRRQSELLAINGTSQQDYDNAVLITGNIKADMELLRVNIARTEIRAPYTGRLGLRNISLGAYVTPLTNITSIADDRVMKVEFTVPERYAPEMTNGRMVKLKSDGSSKEFGASIIASQNSVAQDTRNLTVRAVIQQPDKQLTPGAFVTVKVVIGDNAPAIMIPSQAVIPTTRYKKVIVSNQGKASFVTVNTGFRDSSRVEILEGLKVGDTVIINGLLTIKEGMPVKVKVQ